MISSDAFFSSLTAPFLCMSDRPAQMLARTRERCIFAVKNLHFSSMHAYNQRARKGAPALGEGRDCAHKRVALPPPPDAIIRERAAATISPPQCNPTTSVAFLCVCIIAIPDYACKMHQSLGEEREKNSAMRFVRNAGPVYNFGHRALCIICFGSVWKNEAGVQISALGSCFLLFISRGQLFRNAIHCASSFYCLFSLRALKRALSMENILGKSHLFHAAAKEATGRVIFLVHGDKSWKRKPLKKIWSNICRRESYLHLLMVISKLELFPSKNCILK
jgi:hypothetical protein